ncbi:MAG TPA: FtsX-like permease family protein [Micromonosporaceae bacterium]|jgi:putative ABC transport system permease protein
MLRATLKSMLSRKLRLLLSTLAVVLGVMFVSGAFVLTDTIGRSFDGLFQDIYTDTDVQVTRVSDINSPTTGQAAMPNMPASDVDRIAAVPGVARAVGGVFVDGAKVIDKFGKVVATTGSPRFGAGWTGTSDLVEIRSGRPPQADNEIMISANLATKTGYGIGDTVAVITPIDPVKRSYQVVGIAGFTGGRDTMAGETIVYFTMPVAQQRLLGQTGVFSAVTVFAADGQDNNQLRDRIAAALGPDFSVKTGEQLAQDSSNQIRDALKFFNYLLLGFAGVALFVGVFIILNTFSITVAQRTRELALLRAMGAGRNQVIGSVLTEAAVIGLVASVVGLALGVGVGSALALGLGSLITNGGLHLAGAGLPAAAVIAAFTVGLGITLVAALIPAVRAARIPPVAAMRDAATPDRPVTTLSISGAALLAVGGTFLGLGLAGELGGLNLWAVLGGVLFCFVGVALLTPLFARPVVTALGRALSWGGAGKLGRSNSGRNPRRTAITAAALMVGVAIVTAISVIFSSVKASTVDLVDAGLNANLVIAADPTSATPAQIDPAELQTVRQLPGVEHVVGESIDGAKINGQLSVVSTFDDIAGAVSMLRIQVLDGTLNIGPGEIVVDDKTAAEKGLTVGQPVRVQLARTGEQQMRLAGIYKSVPLASGYAISEQDAQAGFTAPAPITAFVVVRPGADVNTVLGQVREAIADNPEVNVFTVDEYVASAARIFDTILGFVQILLALALVIAVLGVINTLALSMIERTREVGLLRAVGMRRRQVMWMVTVESVVICVFGALLGIAVGTGLGVSAFQAFRDQGLKTLAFPWQLTVIYLIASVFVGLGAAFTPALRAARQDVLGAIAYE